MANGSWQASVPLSVLSDEESEPLQSGLGTRVSAPGNPGNEMLFWSNSPSCSVTPNVIKFSVFSHR